MSENERGQDSSQYSQTDLLSSPETGKAQERMTHSSSQPYRLPTEEDNRLQAAYLVLYTVPRAIENFIVREYKGGFVQAIHDYKDKLKAKLKTEEWNLLSQLLVHYRLYHFYDKIVQDTILDKDVLDKLISKCILRIEDRAEIEHYPRQSDRNKCILDLLIQRPQDSYSILLEVLKESSTCSTDLIACLEGQQLSHHEVVSQSKVKTITGYHSVRLQKNYYNLTENLSDVRNVIDLLISKGVLAPDDHAEIVSSGVSAEINRRLIAKIRSEQDYLFLLEALKVDPCNGELAHDLESTDVSQDELNLVQTATVPSLTNRPGFQTLVTLVSMVKAVQIPNTEPDSHDTSLSADLYRLQSWYKKIIKMTSMDSHQYQQFVEIIQAIFMRIGGKENPAVIEIRLSPVLLKQVKKILDHLQEQDEKETEQEEVIPRNIREQIKEQLEDWEKKDKKFVSTRASNYVMECVQDNNCVTLTAPAGVGKSFICRHTALVLQKKGYKIVLVYAPTDIRDYYQPGKQTVFIVDDICGNYTANQQQIDNWKQLLPVINKIIADKCCKIIVSCRLQVYKDDKFKILSPFKSCECNLISDELCLTSDEKTTIAKTYISTNLKDIDDLSQNSEFFPLLCSLYVETKNSDMKEFFRNPFVVYKDELDKLSEAGDEGNYKICSLALCVLFNNQLEEKWFQGKVTDEQRQIINDTCEACEFIGIPKAKLKKALDTLDGTFICKQNGIYRTVHDKLFDFLAHYFGQKMIECLIDHGDSGLLHERFMWRKSPDNMDSNIDFIIEIKDDDLKSYLERFIKEWSAGKVSDVFDNINMKVSSFRQQLLQYLLQLDKSQQVTLAHTRDTVRPKEEFGSGNTPLIDTCYEGYHDMVQWMLHNDVDVDQCKDNGTTGLIMASLKGHTEIVKLLLEKNPNVDLCNNDGWSPLNTASQEGHTEHAEIVKLLLENNPNVDLCNKNGWSPLNTASNEGHTDIVKLLLEKNPNVDLCNNNGWSPLNTASNEGHTDIVKLLLEENPNVDLCNNNGWSPLNTASDEGHTEIVKLLLEKNPNVDLCNNDGLSPLNTASLKGHTEIVKLLLEKNPNVDLCNNNGWSPLNTASNEGHTDIVKLLLEKNPNVDLCNNDGWSPLNTASLKGHTEIVKLLLEKNPNVDLCNNDGWSPLNTASLKGHTEIVKLLLEKNPNVDLCNNNDWSPLNIASKQGHTEIVKLLLEKNPNVDLCDNDGWSPLNTASLKGHTEIVKLLLEKNPNVDLCNNNGWSPLNTASQEGHTDIVKLLLEKNPNVDLCNNDGWSPLYTASDEGHTDIVKLLLEKNPNVDLCNKDGWSPLNTASLKGHTEIVKLLLEKNPNVDLCNNNGWSPLNTASQEGHTDIVKLLLEKNPNVDLCNNDGWSPLQKASDEGHTDIVKLLLEKNPNVDLCNNDGWSPLNTASDEGHTEIVKLLLEKNPNVDLCNNNGFTPLISSCINNHTNIVQLLIKHKPNINAQTYDGGNALYFSAFNGNLVITQLLLENNADCNICIHSKQSIIDKLNNHPSKTLDKEKKELFDSLVKNTSSHVTDYVSKKSVDYAFDVVAGSSPLHIASYKGRTDVVNCLLDHNANINMTKEDGTTPLFYACEVGHEDIVRLLSVRGSKLY
ncbi:uncharacterized protein LOC127712830 [Mytilus californianus]|uniref:uncharacterized protein LOC127712830 n=1 Tax=Mytilus californianus TaxID=6549 RepID=UPI0022465B22|nr:uncharacterized protein LOC127712830 [Mytilus californianus]